MRKILQDVEQMRIDLDRLIKRANEEGAGIDFLVKAKDYLGMFALDHAVCLWKYSNAHGGHWVTNCGLTYDADDFGCSSIKTCPSCGKKAEV